jgi:hypothetical protein
VARLPEISAPERAARQRSVENDRRRGETYLGVHPLAQHLGDPLRVEREVELGDHFVERLVELAFRVSHRSQDARVGTNVGRDRDDRCRDFRSVDVDASDVLAEAACLRHEDRPDPLAFGKQVVRVRADDHVDLSLDEVCEPSIRRGRVAPGGHRLETEMRQTDDQLGAALAKFTRAPSNDLHLVESANAEIDVAVEEVAKWIRDAEKADAVDDGRLLRALHRFQVCEQERVARRARLLRDHLRSVAQPHRIADGGDLAAGG